LVDRIQNLCESKGMTLTSLERELGLGKSTIRKWDTNAPSIDKVEKVASFFHVSIDYLMGRVDDPDYMLNTDLPDILKKLGYDNVTMLMDSELTQNDIRQLVKFALSLKKPN
jgi:transcriptional regulator with XRE-family HTH domain